MPFDWLIPLFPSKTKEILENNFSDFIPDVDKGIFVNKYNVALAHFNKNITEGVNEYKRRIERFNNLINEKNKKIYFVYINEDYLYDKNYRTDEFNMKILNEMLDLEKFLKEKYSGIDFNILFFNFHKYNISCNTNIIYINLSTSRLYETPIGSPYESLRNYCGSILSKIFNTKYTPGYNEGDFYK